MADINRGILLSAIHVQWSTSRRAYEASSDQYPGSSYADGGSALAAIDGLIDVIRDMTVRSSATS